MLPFMWTVQVHVNMRVCVGGWGGGVVKDKNGGGRGVLGWSICDNVWSKDGCWDKSVFWVKMGQSVERSARESCERHGPLFYELSHFEFDVLFWCSFLMFFGSMWRAVGVVLGTGELVLKLSIWFCHLSWRLTFFFFFVFFNCHAFTNLIEFHVFSKPNLL